MKLNKLTQSLGRFFRIQHNENLQMIEDEVNQLHQDDMTTNSRIDNLIINASGDDITQVIDALVDRHGKAFPTLHNLLTTKDQEYADQFKKPQMSKITQDDGSVKYSLTEGDNILTFVQSLPRQLFTIYCTGNVGDIPSATIGKGMGHVTGDGEGWISYYDARGRMWSNVLSQGSWNGWQKQVYESDFATNILWSGAAYMNEGGKIKPNKKLSECRFGYLLVWSDYNPAVGVNDWDFVTSIIPKVMTERHDNSHHIFIVPSYSSDTSSIDRYVNKILRVRDSEIEGNAINDKELGGPTGDTNRKDVCLRYVIEL